MKVEEDLTHRNSQNEECRKWERYVQQRLILTCAARKIGMVSETDARPMPKAILSAVLIVNGGWSGFMMQR